MHTVDTVMNMRYTQFGSFELLYQTNWVVWFMTVAAVRHVHQDLHWILKCRVFVLHVLRDVSPAPLVKKWNSHRCASRVRWRFYFFFTSFPSDALLLPSPLLLLLYLLLLLLLLFLPGSPACQTSSFTECQGAPFVPGHNLVGEVFNVATLKTVGASVIDVKSFMVGGAQGNCTSARSSRVLRTVTAVQVVYKYWSCSGVIFTS